MGALYRDAERRSWRGDGRVIFYGERQRLLDQRFFIGCLYRRHEFHPLVCAEHGGVGWAGLKRTYPYWWAGRPGFGYRHRQFHADRQRALHRDREQWVGLCGGGWDPTAGGSIFTSSDFVNWNYQIPVSYTSTVLYTGSNYVAAGTDYSYISPNGTTWSTDTAPSRLTSMGYGAGRYVAGQRDPAISYLFDLISSTDAINWSVVDSSNILYFKVRYLNNTFYALGQDQLSGTGAIHQSADGIHWQDITPQLDSGTSWYTDVFYDGTKYYFTGARNYSTFFSISTTDPTNTSSYGAMGGVTSRARAPRPGITLHSPMILIIITVKWWVRRLAPPTAIPTWFIPRTG